MAKVVSLVIKAGALLFIIYLPLQYAIWLQLLGGVWIIQTAPPVLFSLYTRFFNGWALLIGWVCGFGLGTLMVLSNGFVPVYPLHIGSMVFPCYIAVIALVVNIVVSFVVSLPLNAVASDRPADLTAAEDYA